MTTKKIYTPEEAVERLNKLPKEARDLIYTKETRDILMKIGEKHKLHLDQLAGLETETNSVILGFTEPNDFPQMLSDSMQVDISKANDIAKDVSDMLFKKIRESMKGTYWKGSEESLPVSTPAAPAKPAAPMRDISVVMPSKAAAAVPMATAPSSAGAPPGATPPNIAPPMPPAVPKPANPVVPPAPKPVVPPPVPAPQAASHAPEMMLSETTISLPAQPGVPPKPANPAPATPPTPAPPTPAAAAKTSVPPPAPYKTDPYREPPE